MKLLGWLVIVGAGCGAVSDQPIDAPPADTCDLAKPFGAPVAITELNSSSANDGPATLTADELTVYFTSDRAGGIGGSDIYIATRPTRDARWGTPALLAGVNTTGHESRPMLSADGLVLYAETNTVGSDDWDISVATRANVQASFSAFARDPALNGTGSDAAPMLRSDGGAIYFLRAGDLYRSLRAGSTSWTMPMPIAGVNSSSAEHYPLISADDLTLYFVSNKPGGMGELDIYVATRASAAVEFGAPVPLTDFNTPVSEFPNWISRDGCEIWFSRITNGNSDLYLARRPR